MVEGKKKSATGGEIISRTFKRPRKEKTIEENQREVKKEEGWLPRKARGRLPEA